MIYDSWLQFLQTILFTFKFFRDHPTVPGVLFLILRQNNIRKAVNRRLPHHFRDNMESDIRHIQADIKRIMDYWRIPGWVVEKQNSKEPVVKKSSNGLRMITFLAHFTTYCIRHLAIKNWRYTMQNLLSKKFLLAILGAIIPVINLQFGLNLDINTLIGIWTVLGIAIAAIAHVDAKTASAALNAVKVAVTADPNTTYKDMIKTVNIVHGAISSILVDLKKDDGSAAFKAAADAYTQLHSIVDDFRKPDPLPEIPPMPDKQVSA